MLESARELYAAIAFGYAGVTGELGSWNKFPEAISHSIHYQGDGDCVGYSV